MTENENKYYVHKNKKGKKSTRKGGGKGLKERETGKASALYLLEMATKKQNKQVGATKIREVRKRGKRKRKKYKIGMGTNTIMIIEGK